MLALAGAAIALAALILESRSARATREAEILLTLDERWESDGMRERRRAAATQLRRDQASGHPSNVNPDLRLVLNFLEGIVLFVESKLVGTKKTEDHFRAALIHYRHAAHSQIDLAQQEFGWDTWKTLTDYCDRDFPNKPGTVDRYLELEIGLS